MEDIVYVYLVWLTTVHLLMNEWPSVVEITAIKTFGHVSKKPKNRPADKRSVERNLMKSELQKVSIIYIGESKRSWKSRGGSAEQKPGTNGIVGFAVKQRAEGVFLESLHLFLDKNSVDEFRDLQSTFL